MTGATTLNGAATLNNTLAVNGATTLNGAATLNNTLAVAGNTTLAGTASVTGATTLNGAATLNNTLAVNGATTLNGAATLNNNLTVAGNTTLTGSEVLTGSLTANGNATLNSANNLNSIAVNNGGISLAVGGNSLLLTAAGASVNAPLTVNGNASVNGNLTVTPGHNFTLGGNSVSGIAVGSQGDNTLLATKGYVDSATDALKRGIAMTAALQTPVIEEGKNNAGKLSIAEYGGKAGFSLGYARRIFEGLSADLEAAADDSFEDGVVRAGVNYSW